jgi:hypothetical protein
LLFQALEQSVNLFETHGRHGAKKRVILFANGKSGANPSHLKKCATLLEDSNVKVVTVAVGDDVNEEELRHINPDEEAIVKVDTLEEPESAVFAVARQVQGNNSTTTLVKPHLKNRSWDDGEIFGGNCGGSLGVTVDHRGNWGPLGDN